MKNIIYRIILPLLLVFLLAGCATQSATHNPLDPYESFNRRMFNFNETMMKTFIRPAVNVYTDYAPMPVRTGIHNFFANVNLFNVILNDLLQFNFRYAWHDSARLIINSTLGCLGLIDVASDINLNGRVQGFGLTLAKWGYKNSSYLVMPFLGPSTIRGTTGLFVDYATNPVTLKVKEPERYYWYSVELVQMASDLEAKDRVLRRMALDPYVAVRNAYMQNRKFLVEKIVNEKSNFYANE